MPIRPIVALALVLLAPGLLHAQADDPLAALRMPGYFGLMRHSTAPGSDDPPEFRLGVCTTQRNLSPGGRAQAMAIGARLRASGLTGVRVVSSPWCRTLDTARFMAIGPVEELAALGSLVSYPGQSGNMTADVRSWIQKQDLTRPLIMVTHQINISALVGAYPEEGEIVVVQRTPAGDLRVVGTIAAD